MKKTILHLCADIGSDSWYYQQDPAYDVIKIGSDVGVENVICDQKVHGVIANPVCTEFSTAKGFHKDNSGADLSILFHCLRIIFQTSPKWYVIENPGKGTMRDVLGPPDHSYQPWHYGSPWCKQTALWGRFNMPPKVFKKWEDVPDKLPGLYVRPGRGKPSLAFNHRNHINVIPEFEPFKPWVHDDNGFRSLCSQKFAKLFYEHNP